MVLQKRIFFYFIYVCYVPDLRHKYLSRNYSLHSLPELDPLISI